MKEKIFYLSLVCLFSGCLGFDTKEKVVENFYLVAPDDESQVTLSYCDPADENGCVPIISETVFAVGYNQNYIIAKQHPTTYPNPPNKSVNNFFIVPIEGATNYRTSKNFIGPLTFDEYNESRKTLNIPEDLNFTIEKTA